MEFTIHGMYASDGEIVWRSNFRLVLYRGALPERFSLGIVITSEARDLLFLCRRRADFSLRS
jgi:hypothetical protein